LVKSFYKGISAVFFVYSIDNLESFLELKSWIEEVREYAHEEVVVFLIAAKADIQDKREVSSEMASTFLREIQGAFHLETSAKTGLNI
jgi:GTPase SAR1 family protein